MTDLSEFVTLTNATLVTDSRRVAKHFKKRPDNILRAYDNLKCSAEFNRLNFEECFEINNLANGKKERIIRMTKNGFMFLVMGFTGKEAARIKEAYINAFDKMAEQLQQISMGLWEQRMALEKRDATSFMWASFGAKRMNERRRELPGIKTDRERLESKMQPILFNIGFEPDGSIH